MNNKIDIKVGDVVRVNNWGSNYSTYTKFFNDNKDAMMEVCSLGDIACYRYGASDTYDRDSQFTVLFTEKHYSNSKTIAFIRSNSSGNTYLVSTDALDVNSRRLTHSEIAEMLGFDFVLVEEV